MIRIVGTIFAGVLGLAFGSFLNVCLSRWPQGESVVQPRSHCRNCEHVLTWWENVPLVSWLALRGRCRKCGTGIGWRYPLVEVAVGGLWAVEIWRFLALALDPDLPAISLFAHFNLYNSLGTTVGRLILYWLLVGLAVLDAERLWLPDSMTIPGIVLGITSTVIFRAVGSRYSDDLSESALHAALSAMVGCFIAILVSAGLILLIRWLYKLVRKREGIGLGDAKLMALLAAWLGLPGALLAFGLGAVMGAVVALVLLVGPRRGATSWAATKLPLGTFLCIGGIISSLWGEPLIHAYLRWAGF